MEESFGWQFKLQQIRGAKIPLARLTPSFP
jgi:hypothetical protein